MKLLELDVSTHVKNLNAQKEKEQKLNAQLKDTLNSILQVCDEKSPASKKI